LAIHRCIFIFFLFLLWSCSSSVDQIHNKVSDNKHQIPIISIVADSLDLFDDTVGIYYQGIGTAENWQGQRANYYSGKKIAMNMAYFIDGKVALKQDAKMKVSGGGSRKQPQKSFNLSCKEGFTFPFFSHLPYEHYKSLRLRVSGQDWRETLLRDALMHNLVLNTEIDVQAYQPVVVYLNEKYWGIYNIREKFNKAYLQKHHNVDEVDILERNSKLIEGSSDEYLELLAYVQDNDLSRNEHWNWVEERVDLENFIDYYCAQIYFANTDWPANNIKYWKASEGKWRWFLHDTDLGFAFAPIWGHPGGLNHNTLQFVLNDSATTHHNQPWSTLLFRKFLNNEQFKQEFIRKFANHLEVTFHPERVVKTIDSLAANIIDEMPRHIDRWKDEADYALQSVEDWQSELDVLRSFALQRPAIVRTHLQMQFKFIE